MEEVWHFGCLCYEFAEQQFAHDGDCHIMSVSLKSALLALVTLLSRLELNLKCSASRMSLSFPDSFTVLLVLADISIILGRMCLRGKIDGKARCWNATCLLLWNSGASVGRQAAMMEVCASMRNHVVTRKLAVDILSTKRLASALATCLPW